MQKVLITGATGFIGKFLVQFLLQKKFKIRILARSLKNLNFDSQIEIFHGDLTNRESLKGVCNSIDTIFHLGGYAHAEEENNSSFSNQHHLINFEGTKNLLEEAKNAKVTRFIFFSSVKAVGDNPKCIDENWDAQPSTAYGIAKRSAEESVLSAMKEGMHVCVLRPALVYGPNWKGNLASMLRSIDRGFFPPLPETYNYRSLVGLEDLCNAAFLAASNRKSNGQIYFVTDGISYSSRQLYILMCQALEKKIPTWHIPLVMFKTLAYIGDVCKKINGSRFPFNSEVFSKLFGTAQYSCERIENDLGFKPNFTLEKSLPKIIKAYHDNLGSLN